uniref:protein-serine/threonine phosphatase n=1 Tax=Ananas comosus var. bracteatus TaxID=296719 RepID=A0A6V7NRI9_ANACO|nr:unnamed protein product [Ananas comosus var. bracteatus]
MSESLRSKTLAKGRRRQSRVGGRLGGLRSRARRVRRRPESARPTTRPEQHETPRHAVQGSLRRGQLHSRSPSEARGASVKWAQGKAGEDRVHLVVSEEHGRVFVGIYDCFNGPHATDYLLSNL